MTKSIYKYFSADVFEYVFKDDQNIYLKCSLPKDYNDPYELFLGIHLTADTECLATYKTSLGDIPQLYTTCFATSGSSSPMWAHYAKNHSGFVVEFGIDEIQESLPDSRIKEITYRDTPDESILFHLQRAAVTGKARHTMWMMDAIVHHAYFTKQTCWSYEEEQRLFGINKHVKDSILSIENSCVKSIISGKNSSKDFDNNASLFANKIGARFLKSHIGKSYPRPFFRDEDDVSYIEIDTHTSPSPYTCDSCNEPTIEPVERCVWCNISDRDLANASHRSMLSAIHRMGGLDDYIQQFRAVGKKR